MEIQLERREMKLKVWEEEEKKAEGVVEEKEEEVRDVVMDTVEERIERERRVTCYKREREGKVNVTEIE